MISQIGVSGASTLHELVPVFSEVILYKIQQQRR